jgi:hypothetical protein
LGGLNFQLLAISSVLLTNLFRDNANWNAFFNDRCTRSEDELSAINPHAMQGRSKLSGDCFLGCCRFQGRLLKSIPSLQRLRIMAVAAQRRSLFVLAQALLETDAEVELVPAKTWKNLLSLIFLFDDRNFCM